jgi:hypothetical protein
VTKAAPTAETKDNQTAVTMDASKAEKLGEPTVVTMAEMMVDI